MRLLPPLALAATLLPAAAHAQASATLCQRQPGFIGCLPLSTSLPRTAALPIGVGDTARRITLDAFLKLITPADLPHVDGKLDLTSTIAPSPTGPGYLRVNLNGADLRLPLYTPAQIDAAPPSQELDVGPTDFAANPGTTEFQAANSARTARGGGLIRVRPGARTLSGNVYTGGDNAWLFERGATLAGPGQLDAVSSSAILGSAGLTLARLYSAPSNEHGIFVSLRAAPTTGPSYEKTGFIAKTIQNDPSSYDGSGALRDLVGLESQGSIQSLPGRPANLTGRIWGINTAVGPDAGADGYAVGIEAGVSSSSGSAAGPLGTPTSKIGVHIPAYGTSTSTAALVVSPAGTTWQDGLVVSQEALDPGGHALSVRPISRATAIRTRVNDVAWIGRDGSASFTSIAVPPGGEVGLQSHLITTVQATFQAGFYLEPSNRAFMFFDTAKNRLVFAYNGQRLWSVDTSGTMRTAGPVIPSTTP